MSGKGIWYILFVRTGAEEDVCTFLNHTGINSFIPKKEVIYRREGRSIIQIRPMFPGYLFITSDLPQEQFHAVLQQMRSRKSGIVKELYYDREGTSALTAAEQDMLEGLLDQDQVLTASTGIIENDQVVVLQGPLKGYESRIVRIDRHKRQALLELNLCTRKVQVSVALEVIQKIHTTEK
jgi:transcriptional antiterminator NusG